MGGRRRIRAFSTRLLVLVVALAWMPVTAAAAPGDELEAAQARANRAAAELAEAEEATARAEDAVAGVQARVDAIDARVAAAREQVRELAIRLYVGGAAPVLRLLRMADANEVVRAQQYSHVVAGASTDALQQFRADRENLRREQAELEQQQGSHADSLEDHRARQADAIEELDRLAAAAARAAEAEAERREAEGRASATAGGSEESSSTGQSSTGPLTATPSPVGTTPISPTGPSPTTPTPTPTSTTPTTAPPTDPETPTPSDWLCPVRGPHAFSDDYGAPRGGGFRHQGNDILAPRGTPVVASVDGEVRHRQGAVSGLAYYLDGDDGHEYFGAHLDSFGTSGRVTAGTVVGTVGNTGDAASTAPHLHFEIHPGGSGYENPYPTLVKYC